MSRTTIALLIAAALASLAVLARQGESSLSPAEAFPSSIPPKLHNRSSPETLRRGHQRGLAFAMTADRSVLFEWTASIGINDPIGPVEQWSFPEDPLHDGVSTRTTEIGTRYYPTALSTIDSETVVVAGYEVDGKTVIERWMFRWPAEMPTGVHDPATGMTVVPVVVPERTRVDVLYSADVADRRIVQSACGYHRSAGPALKALVQFHDSYDLYSVDLASGALDLIASPTSGDGLLGLVPELAAHGYDKILPREKIGEGFVYTMGRIRAGVPGAHWPALVLQDSDRDGALDGYRVYGEAEWLAEGWKDPFSFSDDW